MAFLPSFILFTVKATFHCQRTGSNCYNNGVCQKDGFCQCPAPYSGDQCRNIDRPDFTSLCDAEHYGLACELKRCKLRCDEAESASVSCVCIYMIISADRECAELFWFLIFPFSFPLPHIPRLGYKRCGSWVRKSYPSYMLSFSM